MNFAKKYQKKEILDQQSKWWRLKQMWENLYIPLQINFCDKVAVDIKKSVNFLPVIGVIPQKK